MVICSKVQIFKQFIILCCLMMVSVFSWGNEAGLSAVSSNTSICDLSVSAIPICNDDCTYDFNITIEGTGSYNITVNGKYLATGLEEGTYQIGPVLEPFYDLYVEDIIEIDCYQELSGAWECNGGCQVECPVKELNFGENFDNTLPIMFCPSFCTFEEYDNYFITEISTENGSEVTEQGGKCINFVMADTFTKDTFNITACNSSGICETVIYIVSIENLNLYNDYVNVILNTPVSIDVLANDVGTALTISGFRLSEHGTVTQNGNSLVYTPNAGYIGEDMIEYSACGLYLDEEECGIATVFINVIPECIPNMSIEMAAGEDILICPSFCDLQLPVTITEFYSYDSSNIELVEDGCFVYTAQPGVFHDEISILACSDLVDDCNDWMIEVIIDDNVSVPHANDNVYTVYNNGITTLSPLDNDLGSNLQIVGVGTPTSGTCNVVNGGQNLLYAPVIGYIGLIQFDYTICNDVGNCTQGMITINLINPSSTPFISEPDFEITTKGQPVTICMLENDIIETDYYEIDFIEPDIGMIEFTAEKCVNYIPPSSYIGSVTFYYQICDAAENCSDLTPITVFIEEVLLLEANDDYEATDMNTQMVISPLTNDVLSEFVGPIETTVDDLFESVLILDEPENGTVLISYGEDCSDAANCVFFFYTPNIDYSGLDQFTYLLCGPETCDSATVYIQVGVNCSEFCVWPGDANNDGVANHLDVLNIGYNYGKTGPERLVQTNNWEAQAAFDWEITTEVSGPHSDPGIPGIPDTPGTPPTSNNNLLLVDAKYSDSNGTGFIDMTDIQAITDNYGLTHGKTDEVKEINEDVQITLEIRQENIEPGTWIDIDLFVDGVDNQDVNGMYGIAFQIDYFNEYEGLEIVPADSIKIEFIDSWFNNYGADQTLSLFQNLNSLNGSSVLDIGYVKANHIGSSGGGAVAKMSCFITENITGKTASEIPLFFKVINPALVLENGFVEELNESLVESKVNSIGTGVEPIHIYNDLKVFPNPANDLISINVEKFAEKITIVDVLGKIYYEKKNVDPGIQTFSLENIPTGIYLLKVKSGESMYIQKVIII